MTNPNDSACGTQTLDETTTGPDGFIRLNLTQPLTKRETFAAMALSGMVQIFPHFENEYDETMLPVKMAKNAVRFADALIAALNETK